MLEKDVMVVELKKEETTPKVRKILECYQDNILKIDDEKLLNKMKKLSKNLSFYENFCLIDFFVKLPDYQIKIEIKYI